MEIPATPRTYRLLSAGNVALVSGAVITVTTLAVWLFGLGQHRSLFANSLISTTILFVAFCAFTTVGLYHGVKLRDDVGRLTDRISRNHFPSTSGLEGLPNFDFSGSHGIMGILAAIVMAVVVAILAVFIIWLVGALLWTCILIFAAMLYWVFFRALRLVFKNSNRCRGRWVASLGQGLGQPVYGLGLCHHLRRPLPRLSGCCTKRLPRPLKAKSRSLPIIFSTYFL